MSAYGKYILPLYSIKVEHIKRDGNSIQEVTYKSDTEIRQTLVNVNKKDLLEAIWHSQSLVGISPFAQIDQMKMFFKMYDRTTFGKYPGQSHQCKRLKYKPRTHNNATRYKRTALSSAYEYQRYIKVADYWIYLRISIGIFKFESISTT